MASSDEGERLLKCALNNDATELRKLLKNGADKNYSNKNGETAVWFASRNVSLDSLLVLIEFKANLDARLNNGGVTGLWIAAANGHIEVIQTLLKGGADPNIADSRGVTPLWTAASYGFHQIVKLLLSDGVNCDCKKTRNNGESCLWVACKLNFLEVVDILLLPESNADLELAREDGHTPLMAASEGGFFKIVERLIQRDAKINTRCRDGQTALSLTAANGHDQVVSLLLKAGAVAVVDLEIDAQFDAQAVCPLAQCCAYDRRSTALLLRNKVTDIQRLKAADICRQLGYTELAQELDPEISPASKGRALSLDGLLGSTKPDMKEICTRMTAAGFTRERSRVQTAAADIVQEIYRNFFNRETVFILGSFGDGWGCNLRSADGSVSQESDIDFTEIMPGRKYHINNFCRCSDVLERDKVDYEKGHIKVTDLSVVSQPAMTTEASPVTPSMDIVYAFATCAYPKLSIVDESDEACRYFPKRIAEKLRIAARSPGKKWSTCHLIRAGTPSREGTELRVSTSILERICLRLLSIEQGQFYIILKFIVKKVLGVSNQEHQSLGLKSYHAKSLLLFMLRETPSQDWLQDNFPRLLIRALDMLISFIDSSGDDTSCMPHFFLSDTVLYFKKEQSPKSMIVEHIVCVIKNINRHLCEFRDQLKPLERSDYLTLHPFALFPFGFSLISDKESADEYHNAYIAIKRNLRHIMNLHRPLTESDYDDIDKIPSFANTAKICLRVLAYLRENKDEEAMKLLSDSRTVSVYRGLKVPAGLTKTKIKEAIRSQLKSQDTLWRISCRMSHDAVGSIRFAREGDSSSESIVCRDCFPCSLPFHERRVYLNFSLLLHLLRLNFCADADEVRATADDLVKDVLQDLRSADFEELHAVALATEDISQAREMLKEMLKRYDKRHTKIDEVIRSILMRCNAEAPQLGAPRLQHDDVSAACLLKMFQFLPLVKQVERSND